MKKLSTVLNEGHSKEEALAIKNAKTLSDLASGTIDAREELLDTGDIISVNYAIGVANIKDDGTVGSRFTSLLSGSGSAWY